MRSNWDRVVRTARVDRAADGAMSMTEPRLPQLENCLLELFSAVMQVAGMQVTRAGLEASRPRLERTNQPRSIRIDPLPVEVGDAHTVLTPACQVDPVQILVVAVLLDQRASRRDENIERDGPAPRVVAVAQQSPKR